MLVCYQLHHIHLQKHLRFARFDANNYLLYTIPLVDTDLLLRQLQHK